QRLEQDLWRPVNFMATTKNSPDYAAVAAEARVVSDDFTTSMKDFAAGQAARATRLTAVRDRLKKSPKTPPRVLQNLNQAITLSTARAQAMGGLADRIAQRPTFEPADLVVFGHVTTATAAMQPDMSVRLTDSVGHLSVGSPVKVASSGDFSLVFKACEIP